MFESYQPQSGTVNDVHSPNLLAGNKIGPDRHPAAGHRRAPPRLGAWTTGRSCRFGLFPTPNAADARPGAAAGRGRRGQRAGPRHHPGPPLPGPSRRRLDPALGHRRAQRQPPRRAQRREPAAAPARRAGQERRDAGPRDRRPGRPRPGRGRLLGPDRGGRRHPAHPRRRASTRSARGSR